MTASTFRFKQFGISQQRTAMKLGTDAVLLGAVACVPDDGTVLDIGTGTGIVAIMAAQRSSNARITGIELNGEACADAVANAAASPWSDRIEVVRGDVRTFDPGRRFDCIVSNPPYYEGQTRSGDAGRDMARHDGDLTYAELMRSAARLLADEGTCTVIIPADCTADMVREANANGLFLSRETAIVTREGKAARRTILQFRRKVETITAETITVRDKDGNYTEQYAGLTRDFYLFF